MPRHRIKPGPIPQGGSSGLALEAAKLKLTAEESLAIVKAREKERIDSGEYYYESTRDINGKITRTLVKRKP